MRQSAFTSRAATLSIVLLAVAACGPRHDHAERGDRGERGGFRAACAADIQKFCANDEKRREQKECLRNNEDKLSADCKTALAKHHGEGRKDKDDD